MSETTPLTAGPGGRPATGDDADEQAARRRIRGVLGASAVLLVLVMLLPILTSFTSVLDGVVAGMSVAYIAGFAEFVIAMAGAVAYCRWADRAEDRAGDASAATRSPEPRP